MGFVSSIKAVVPLPVKRWAKGVLLGPEPEPPRPHMGVLRLPRFSDLAEFPDPKLLPPLDRAEVDANKLTPEQVSWRRDGVVILRKFLPDSIIDPYIARRAQYANPAGWLSPCPYLQVEELRRAALWPPLMRMLRELVGEPMMLHLALTAWVSTEREWHQDDYLNPDFVNSWYAAVWIALDTIDPDSGPFEYVPGSHHWPVLRGERVRQHLTKDETNRREASTGQFAWEKYAERFVTPAIEREITETGSKVERFLGEKGDVLIWHGRLIHRGSKPRTPLKERRSLITHYSGVYHRPDFPERQTDENGEFFAVFDHPLI